MNQLTTAKTGSSSTDVIESEVIESTNSSTTLQSAGIPPSSAAILSIKGAKIKSDRDVRIQVGTFMKIYQNSSEIEQNMPSSSERSEYPQAVPPPPEILLDRDRETSQLVSVLTSSANAKATILGPGGVGKTALACAVLGDSRVIEYHPRRYFMNFDGLSTLDLVYSAFATALDFSQELRANNNRLLEHILDHLRQTQTIICFDNFETFWEPPDNRQTAESLLGHLASLPQLAILVTLRGIQRPRGLSWTRPLLQPLSPLNLLYSRELVRSIVGDDEFESVDTEKLDKLLVAIEGLPLAVTLIGYLLTDGAETTDSLWKRWSQENTQLVENGGSDRLSSLNVSLDVSLHSPRMKRDPDAILVLAAISMLPNGLAANDTWLDDFQSNLPPGVQLRRCIQTLRNVALCQLEQTSPTPRIRMLSPVRQFCLSHLNLHNNIAAALLSLYTCRISENSTYDSHTSYNWVTSEMVNIYSALYMALSLKFDSTNLAAACRVYTKWSWHLGQPTTEIINMAITTPSIQMNDRAHCLRHLADTYYALGRYSDTVEHADQALQIFTSLDDKEGLAWSSRTLGEGFFMLHKYTEAETALMIALSLFREDGNIHGEAATLQTLSWLLTGLNRLESAENHAVVAVELFRQLSDRLREMICLNTLGRVYYMQEQFDDAVRTLCTSLSIGEEINFTRGQANAMYYLGLTYASRDELDKAIDYLGRSMILFERVNNTPKIESARQLLRYLNEKLDLNSVD